MNNHQHYPHAETIARALLPLFQPYRDALREIVRRARTEPTFTVEHAAEIADEALARP